MTAAILILVSLLALGLFAHALLSIYLMLYTWDRPERLRAAAGPASFLPPRLAFTVLLPARDEETVIAETIRKIWSANYPKRLLELVVICQGDDPHTRRAAEHVINAIGSSRLRVAVYSNGPFDKAHALNVGLAASSNEVVVVFDAEDDVHPDIFNVVNTVMAEQGVGVVQGGVQLMNFRDHWFSVFNCLEYFFYYKSKLHFLARAGMIPLGGNTVFIARQLLRKVGGWHVGCLTEDADIGMRLSAIGEPIRVVYDSRWVTREETPHSVSALVRQRTRWHQGFLQVLGKRDWRRLRGRRRQALALLTLGQPLLDAALLASLPVSVLAMLSLKLPTAVALLTFSPLYGLGLQMIVNLTAAVVFAREFGEHLPWRTLAFMPFTYLPYQWLIALSGLRATQRQIFRRHDWEKTEHRGAHRARGPQGTPVPAYLRLEQERA